ncbi:hypothetical protein MKW98_026024 [Papaver atlanticum]|uniref:Kinesin motor domain-containing protein n=1 Tax=Papaver atlanticum TaxID=357466 RepID=A0AAD4X4N5_9MAGN|nr:hypothetical protein MKW98_026024 [Papaver atlanticum]
MANLRRRFVPVQKYLKIKCLQKYSAAVCGFNGTVFAYGKTNSGKTHRMRGSVSEPGVIPLAVRDFFRTIQEDMDREFLLWMSYMEIYNKEMLAPEHRKLQIHESIDRGIFVAGLKEETSSSINGLWRISSPLC